MGIVERHVRSLYRLLGIILGYIGIYKGCARVCKELWLLRFCSFRVLGLLMGFGV